MTDDTIQYRGAYRFANRAALDNALAAALKNNAEWLARFCPHGDALRVDLDLSARSDLRGAAAIVMETLALLAVEGIVVARQRELAIDVFVCSN
jgi:hypothetical protein